MPRDISNHKVNNHSHLNMVTQLIDEAVSNYQLEQFIKNGPFRQFQSVVNKAGNTNQQFPGNLVLRVLACEVWVKNQRDDELWYAMGGVPHRFGKEEFALVSGLWFGEIKKSELDLEKVPLPEGNICLRKWPRKKGAVKAADIEILINGKNTKLRCNEEDAKKLVLVDIIQRLLLGAPNDKCVPRLIWHLVDDLNTFDRFPWGTYVFSKTLKELSGAIDRRFLDGHRKGTNLRAFGYTFVVWSFEFSYFY